MWLLVLIPKAENIDRWQFWICTDGVADKMDMVEGWRWCTWWTWAHVVGCLHSLYPCHLGLCIHGHKYRANTVVVMTQSGASDWAAWDVRTHLLRNVKTFQCLAIRCLVCGSCSVEYWFSMSFNYIMPTSLGLSTFLFPILLISDLPIFSLINQLPWNCFKLLSWATSLSSLRYLCSLLKYLLA